MTRIRRPFLPATASIAAILVVAGTAFLIARPLEAAESTGPRATSLSDRICPGTGNTGYQVDRYSLSIRFHARTGRISASTRIRGTTNAQLRSLSLDLSRHLSVRSAIVGGRKARWRQRGQKLILYPANELRADSPLAIHIRYEGRPVGESLYRRHDIGWVETDDGAWVANQPCAASSWFPSNDHPSDKARYEVSLDVPAALKGISNGDLVSHNRHGKRSTWNWRSREPMATYLVTAAIGRFKVDRRPLDGTKSLIAYDPRVGREGLRLIRDLDPKVRRFLARLLGPYPFDTTGAIIDRPPPAAIYSLETQSRTLYGGNPGEAEVVHELAHQWLGNSVTPASWQDLWLSEGMATWLQWRWSGNHGESTPAELFETLYATVPHNPASRAFWNPPPLRAKSQQEAFDSTTYYRGAMTIEALRQKIGDDDFFDLLRRWATGHAYETVRTADFEALAEQVSGADLSEFFRAWLRHKGRPDHW